VTLPFRGSLDTAKNRLGITTAAGVPVMAESDRAYANVVRSCRIEKLLMAAPN